MFWVDTGETCEDGDMKLLKDGVRNPSPPHTHGLG